MPNRQEISIKGKTNGIQNIFGPGGWKRVSGALGLVALLHVVAFAVLFAAVIPGHHEVNGQVFGIGLAITAYLLGVRHAARFSPSHPSPPTILQQ